MKESQVEGRNAFVTMPSPIEAGSTITVAKAGYMTNEDGPEVTRGPPKIGEHTEQILSDAGYAHDEISRFREEGII